MAILTRVTLKTSFENGDTPSGSDFANMIDSAANLADTGDQQFASTVIAPTLRATSVVSAATVRASSVVSAADATLNALTVVNALSAATINSPAVFFVACSVGTLTATTGTITTFKSTTLSAGTGTFTNLARTASNPLTPVGATQVGAAQLVRHYNVVLSATNTNNAVILTPSVRPSSYLVFNQSTTAVAVFPPTGELINALTTNASYLVSAGRRAEIDVLVGKIYAVKVVL